MRKALVALATVASLLFPATAGAATIGTTTVFSSKGSNPAGVAQIFQFTAPATGTVNRLGFYVDSASTASRVELGLYSAANAQIGRCVVSSLQRGAWNRCAITAVTVTQGAAYGLAFLQPTGSRGKLRYREAIVSGAPTTYMSRSSSLSSLPATWTNGASLSGGYRASINADATVSAPPPPPPSPQCSDGIDNDGDGLIDYPADPGCSSATDTSESPDPAPNQAPSASFTYSPASPQVGQSVQFTDTSSDSDGTIASRAWDLDGDGQFDDSTAAQPTWTYQSAATVTVRLRVTDDKGATADAAHSIIVAGATQPPPPPPPPAGVTLREPDGGTHYFAQFAKHGPMDDPSYFPLWLWGQYNMTNANIAKDKSEGFNGYYALANPEPDANLDGIAAAGMWAILDTDMVYDKPAVIGWRLGDEADMCTNCPSAGFQTMRNADASAPKDGRFRFMNYSKGVAFWWNNTDAGTFVNGDGTNRTQGTPGGFQDVVSADNYWFNDPDLQDTYQGQCLYQGCGVGGNLTADQAQRAYNYALTIKRERDLDALDGKRQPVWGQIEMGWPTTQGTRLITPAQMRGAFWQSIIGGARGVVYFPFAWAGPCGVTHYIQRETSSCWAAINQMATSVNAQAKQLAPVLNAPFADGFVSTSAGIDAMAKAGPDGHYYVFAGNKDNSARTATFALNGITSATATVMGENRSVAITNGSFSDPFADGNAIHIYRIDG